MEMAHKLSPCSRIRHRPAAAESKQGPSEEAGSQPGASAISLHHQRGEVEGWGGVGWGGGRGAQKEMEFVYMLFKILFWFGGGQTMFLDA